jgi:hypothetical protein
METAALRDPWHDVNRNKSKGRLAAPFVNQRGARAPPYSLFIIH